MAKNTFVEQMEDPDFAAWFEQFKNTANYFMAAQGAEDALKICLAYAFKAAKEKR